MAQDKRIPVHAQIIARATLTGATSLDDAEIIVWEGAASDGYKTDYTRRKAVWWQVKRGGRTLRVMRRSGQGLAEIKAAWADMLTIPGMTVAVPLPDDFGDSLDKAGQSA